MRKILCLGLVLALAPAANATFFDDFESYADTAAMMAPGAWGDDGGVNGVLMTTGGNPGQYMEHPGGVVATHVIGALNVANGPIVLEGDIIDDGAGNKRNTIGLRTNGGGASLTGILELGAYNEFTGTNYGYRAVWLGEDGWVAFSNAPTTAGTHHVKAVITATEITFTIDLNADGSIEDTIVSGATGVGQDFNIVRLGGPSNLSSAGGPMGFDNVGIYQIPEPATFALLAFGGLAVLRRR